MASFVQVVVSVLEPYVGDTVADTCVRATALSLGKTSDQLTAADLPQLDASIRRLLGGIASTQTLDGLMAEIERRMS